MLQIWAPFKRWRLVKCQNKIYFSWWTHTDQRGSSSLHWALQSGRLCTPECSERGRAITSHYWVLHSRNALSRLFSKPFTPLRPGRWLIMALHHQLKTCRAVQETENGKILLFTNAQMLSSNIPAYTVVWLWGYSFCYHVFCSLGTRKQLKRFSR